ncbi:MAG: NAD(P)H-hydrate dehydratase [Planctomycetes bacterium]|nr:NAD(P)H-hydrate dehydratase [Planctomycetota bacterium]
MTTVTTLPMLPPRPLDAHKGDFGRVLVVAGSRGMSGAAVLCAGAALRAGAGLVTAAIPGEILPIVAAGNPCYTTSGLPHDDAGRLSRQAEVKLTELIGLSDVVALGPGLGRSGELTNLLVDLVPRIDRPMVIDADGLNAFIGKTDRLDGAKQGRILTPHPGEFARLMQVDGHEMQSRRTEMATTFAQSTHCVLVLKGHETLVTDGERLYRNTTGNPGMATGGTGDVLTGVIAALVGQGLAAFEAAQLGVYLHGMAGDLARDQIGEVSLIATDLLDFLPAAFRRSWG